MTFATRKLLVFSFICLFAGLIALALANTVFSDEMRSKHEWSILQTLEAKYRGKELGTERIILENQEGYYIAGIVSADNNQRTWILLNPRYDPVIKEIPDADYYVSSEELEELAISADIRKEVRDYLKGKR